MAFATTNVNRDAFGSLKVTWGDWSGSAGDAAGTITVEGGRVIAAAFDHQDASGAFVQGKTKYSTSGTAGIITVTVYNNSTVTTGRFWILHK